MGTRDYWIGGVVQCVTLRWRSDGTQLRYSVVPAGRPHAGSIELAAVDIRTPRIVRTPPRGRKAVR